MTEESLNIYKDIVSSRNIRTIINRIIRNQEDIDLVYLLEKTAKLGTVDDAKAFFQIFGEYIDFGFVSYVMFYIWEQKVEGYAVQQYYFDTAEIEVYTFFKMLLRSNVPLEIQKAYYEYYNFDANDVRFDNIEAYFPNTEMYKYLLDMGRDLNVLRQFSMYVGDSSIYRYFDDFPDHYNPKPLKTYITTPVSYFAKATYSSYMYNYLLLNRDVDLNVPMTIRTEDQEYTVYVIESILSSIDTENKYKYETIYRTYVDREIYTRAVHALAGVTDVQKELLSKFIDFSDEKYDDMTVNDDDNDYDFRTFIYDDIYDPYLGSEIMSYYNPDPTFNKSVYLKSLGYKQRFSITNAVGWICANINDFSEIDNFVELCRSDLENNVRDVIQLMKCIIRKTNETNIDFGVYLLHKLYIIAKLTRGAFLKILKLDARGQNLVILLVSLLLKQYYQSVN
jgi:hypothetical protein